MSSGTMWSKELADRYRDGERHGRRSAIEACAAEVAAAGCACLDMGSAEDEELGPDEHYSRCPIALAARLRELA